jgi:hypothetical protein
MMGELSIGGIVRSADGALLLNLVRLRYAESREARQSGRSPVARRVLPSRE